MNFNFKKIGIGCTSAFIFGILFGWAIFPNILKGMLKSKAALKPKSEIREMWSDLPFPLDFLIYVFNVTNPDDVINGSKPILKEIGPYYFEEWKSKYDLVDDEAEDTVTFHMKNTFIFRPDKSNGLTGEEIITLPFLIFQGIALVVKRDRAPMLPLVAKAFKEIFPNEKAFRSAKFLDYFFRGIPIDCSSNEFSAKAVCSAFASGDAKGVDQLNETHYSFSLLGAANATDAGKFTVYRGIENIHNLGRIVRFNDEPEMDVWDGDDCNQYVGTDSTIFPPFLKKEEGLWAYTPDVCRSMGAFYERESSYKGIPTLRYGLDLGDIKGDKKLHCFCKDPPHDCPLKGTMDLMPCIGGPMIASMPHFYNGDESLLKNVEGLNPNKEDHAVYIDFEIISGTPVSAAKRLQFNLDMGPVEEIKAMANLQKIVMPLFWVQESVQLNKTYVNMLKYQLFLALKLNAVIKWSCVILGGLGAIISGFMFFKNTKLESVQPMNNGHNNACHIDEINNSDNAESKESEKY